MTNTFVGDDTRKWLDANTLVGFTDEREFFGHRKGAHNTYPQSIPVEDVMERLFNWEAIALPMAAVITDAEKTLFSGDTNLVASDMIGLWASDNGDFLGSHSSDYKVHQYREWLVVKVGRLLAQGFAIGAAGFLQGRKKAWISAELATFETVDGVKFRPQILAGTSHNGTLSSTFKMINTLLVCDNMVNSQLRKGDGAVVRKKHTKHSELDIESAQNDLGLIIDGADKFKAELEKLTARKVNPQQWSRFLDAYVPMPVEEGRGRTMAENKREILSDLWTNNEMVSPWMGTAFGVLQAINTYQHHESIIRNAATRFERNIDNALSGVTFEKDVTVLKTLDRVLAKA